MQSHYAASGRTVTTPPAPPVAAFTSTTNGLTASVDGSGSSDANGPITAYDWDFGDGGTGTGATAQHPYATGGTYNVTLTVTDNSGNKATVTRPVSVTAPPAPPVAALTSTTNGLTASVDGSGSSDANGPITAYDWDFGDGGTEQALPSSIPTRRAAPTTSR